MTETHGTPAALWPAVARWPDSPEQERADVSRRASLLDPDDVLRDLGPRRAAAWRAVADADHDTAALLCDGGAATLDVVRAAPQHAEEVLAARLGTFGPEDVDDLVVSTLVPAAAAAALLPDPLDGARARRDVERVIATVRGEVDRPRTPPPALSVVVPVHEVGPWLRECLDSLAAQTFTDLEVLLVDAHSTDESVAILADVAQRDERFRVLRPTLHGVAHARNVGVAAARAELLAFCDGHDILPERAYEHLVPAIVEDGSDVVLGSFLTFSATDVRLVDPDWPAFHRRVRARPLEEVPEVVGHRASWGKVFRRPAWDALDLVFPEVVRSDDVVPVLEALLAARSVSVVPETVHLRRDRPGPRPMTAVAASEAAVLSHLGQEVACAETVRERGPAPVRAWYCDVTLRSDTWGEIGRHLSGLGDEPVSPAVVERLAELVDLLGREHLTDLPPGPRAVLALTLAGHPHAPLAARLVRREHLPPDPVDVLGLWARLVRSLPDDDVAELPGRWTLFDRTVSSRIATVLRATDLERGGAVLEDLLDLVGRERAAAHPQARALDFRTDDALTALLGAGPDAFARRVRREHGTAVLLHEVTVTDQGLELAGSWTAPPDYRPTSIAAMVRGKPVAVADVVAGPVGPDTQPAWHATLPGGVLSAGRHRLVVLGTFDEGPSRTVLHHHRPFSITASASGLLVLEQRESTRDVRALVHDPDPAQAPPGRPPAVRRLARRLLRR